MPAGNAFVSLQFCPPNVVPYGSKMARASGPLSKAVKPVAAIGEALLLNEHLWTFVIGRQHDLKWR
jgi:hypothetical protein